MRKFKIVTLSDHNKRLADPFVIGGVVLDAIMNIFGGGSSTGLPGDYDNRVRSVHRWALEFGVKECVNFNKVEQFLLMPAGWQAATTRYYQELKSQKARTGSCQSVFGTQGGGGGATLFQSAQMSPVVVIALLGAAFFILRPKKGRR